MSHCIQLYYIPLVLKWRKYSINQTLTTKFLTEPVDFPLLSSINRQTTLQPTLQTTNATALKAERLNENLTSVQYVADYFAPILTRSLSPDYIVVDAP